MPIDSVLIIVSLLVLALSDLRAASVVCSTVRHCERSAAIQSPALHSLDCFVAPLLEGDDSLKCHPDLNAIGLGDYSDFVEHRPFFDHNRPSKAHMAHTHDRYRSACWHITKQAAGL